LGKKDLAMKDLRREPFKHDDALLEYLKIGRDIVL